MSCSHASLSSYNQRNTLVRRSQPIAIRDAHQLNNEAFEEEREECEKQFYECATWRMYNRIVADRLNTPRRQITDPIYNGGPSPATVGSHSQQSHCSSSPLPLSNGLVRPQPRYAYARPGMVPSVHQPYSEQFCPNPFMDAMQTCELDEEVFDLEI